VVRDDEVIERCTNTAALSAAAFTGTGLSPKQLALTFDDGPGSRTLELSAYLRDAGLVAAFFVNGHCFGEGNPCGNPGRSPAEVFSQLRADGHIVANHTQNHLDLTQFAAGPAGDDGIVNALAATDDLIASYVDFERFLFRAPYGAWNARDYEVLAGSSMSKYVGPIRWDIGGAMESDDNTGFAADWDCWQNRSGFGGKTTAQCGRRYLNEIATRGRGIVLMHDSDSGNTANHQADVGVGNTVDMVKWLVPRLIADGYSFVRLDEVPSIAEALPAVPPPPPAPEPPPAPQEDAGSSSLTAPADGGKSPSEVSPPASKLVPAPPRTNAADEGCGARASGRPAEFPHQASVH
jgi:peptidoglycan/xylan/chitin deacetylase (PgdA/CDA1 family)